MAIVKDIDFDRPIAAGPPDLWTRTTLTPLCAGDAELIWRWQNDPRLRDLTMGFRLPIQKGAVDDWIVSLRDRKDRAVFGARLDGDLVGLFQLFGIDWLHRSAEFGIFLGDTHGTRGPDVAWVAGLLTLDYGFSALNLHRIALRTLGINAPIVRLARRAGFQPEGVLRRDYFADGRYWDTHLYAMFPEELAVRLPREANRLCRRMRDPRPARPDQPALA